MEKEMASLTKDETKVSPESVQESADTVGTIWCKLQE